VKLLKDANLTDGLEMVHSIFIVRSFCWLREKDV